MYAFPHQLQQPSTQALEQAAATSIPTLRTHSCHGTHGHLATWSHSEAQHKVRACNYVSALTRIRHKRGVRVKEQDEEAAFKLLRGNHDFGQSQDHMCLSALPAAVRHSTIRCQPIACSLELDSSPAPPHKRIQRGGSVGGRRLYRTTILLTPRAQR